MRETEVDVGGRGNGKTYRMILAAESNDAVIVASNRMMADSIWRQAKDMGADIRRPLSFDEALKLPFHIDHPVMIDEAQALLESILRQPVYRISICGTDVSKEGWARANPALRALEKLRKVWHPFACKLKEAE